jgi:hypothetical protein
MFRKPEAKNVNEIKMVAPTGFEPVFQVRRRAGRAQVGPCP